MKKESFSVMAIMMIPIAVSFNVIGGQITNILKLPFYLDTIGTILMSCIGGPLLGSGTALLSTLFNSLLRPQALPFALTGIGIAIVVAGAARLGLYRSTLGSIFTGIVLAIVSVMISAPIVVFLFGGVTGTGTSIATGLLLATGRQLLTSVLTTGLIFGLVDKVASSLVAYLLLKRFPQTKLAQFPYGQYFFRKGGELG